MKAEWRSVSTMFGALCVMTSGAVLMPLWCVDSWDTLPQVSTYVGVHYLCHLLLFSYTVICLCQQMLWLLVVHILELDLAQFTLMMLAVLEVRLDSLTVPEALQSTVDMPTQRMLEYDVKVNN